MAICDNVSAGICLGCPDLWYFLGSKSSSDVTSNVKYIRNGDYRLLSGGGGGVGNTLLLRLRS